MTLMGPGLRGPNEPGTRMTPLEELDQIIDEMASYRALVRRGRVNRRDREMLMARLRAFVEELEIEARY